MNWGERPTRSRAQTLLGVHSGKALGGAMRRFPVVSFLCIASILGWCATMLWQRGIFVQAFHWLTFVPFFTDGLVLRFVPIEMMLGTGQIWRLVTPAFLHFSFVHLAFNLVIAIEFGRRTEAVLGSRRFGVLALGIVLVSNLVQYLIEPTPLFGGLSGLNYGLIGFLALRRIRDPWEHRWQVAPALVVFLMIALVLFSIGIGNMIGLQVANGAHWGGFITGLLLGWMMPTRKHSI